MLCPAIKKILFVDDDPGILDSVRRQFRRQFDIVTVTSGSEALESMKTDGPFAVILADMRMRGMDGIEFLTRARRVNPDSVCIMLTGHANLKVAMDALNKGHIFRFLTKPCPTETLAKAFQDGLAEYRRLTAVTRYTYSVEVRNSTAVSTEYSRGCLAVSGYSPQDYQSDPFLWLSIVLPEYRASVAEQARKIMSGVDVGPIEYQIMHKDGAIRWMRDTVICHRNDEGELTRYDGLIEDITDQKFTAQEIKKAAEEWRATFDSITDWICILDKNFRLVRVNRTFAEAVGAEYKELIGKVCFEVLGEKRYLVSEYLLKQTLKTKQSATIETYEPGLGIYIETSTSPIFDGNGEVIGAVHITRDITERKRAGELLRIKDSAIRSSINGIALADLQGKVTYVNDSFLKMWGYDEDTEVIGQPTVSFWQSKSKAKEVAEELPVEGGWVGELVALRKDGSIFDAQVSTSLVTNESGEAVYIMGSFVDVTERKQAEEELRKANEKLREHDRLKSEFVSTVSHELRTPLSIFRNIISNAMAGVMGKISPKLHENLQMADESIRRLTRIIDDFLDISKIEAGKVKLSLKRLDLTALVDEVVTSLTTLAEAKLIEMKSTVPDYELFVDGDYDRLVQVLTNLIANALKFTPEQGHITITVKDVDNQVQVEVADDGPGITKKNLEKIFDRFVQVKKKTGPGAHGTGLGLPIAMELIKMHQGRIWAESRLGYGSKFCFALPKYSPVLIESVS